MADFTKSHVPQFTVDVHQNAYLPAGGTDVDAIATVTATGGGTTGGVPPVAPGQEPRAAVVVMVDCSGSMNYPPDKLRHARQATIAAIDTLRDGVAFAIVAGSHEAVEVYPGDGGLAVAGDTTRTAAKRALGRLTASGGTAIGSWLLLAEQLFRTAPATAVRHALLLTDGRNEHEEPERLRAALDRCAGRFTCDARGMGTDWEVAEVSGIAATLLGSADIVAEPAGLADDFMSLMESAMGKGVGDVSLRLWTPAGATVRFVKQVAPTVVDLTGRRVEAPPRQGDYPTGSWGNESRDYHIGLRVPPCEAGQEMLAARVSLVLRRPDTAHATELTAAVAGTPAGQPTGQPTSYVAPVTRAHGLVRAVWTNDTGASTAMSPHVAHYTGQAELARAIQEGLALRRDGDEAGATARLGRAVQLAHASGNVATARLLAKVVDVADAAAGTVRLKAKVAEADEMTLETRSTKTVRVRQEPADALTRRGRHHHADLP